MGFLRGVADWCRRNIPLVGHYVARAFEIAQWGIESLVHGVVDPIRRWIIDNIWPWLRRIDEFIHDTRDWLVSLIDYVYKTLGPALTEAANYLWRLGDFVYKIIEPALTQAANYLWALGDFIYKTVAPALTNVANYLWRLGDHVYKTIEPALTNAADYLWKLGDLVYGTIAPTIESVKDFFSDPYKYLHDWICSLIGTDKGFLDLLFDKLKAPIETVIETALNLFVENFLDFHIDMDTMEIVEPEAPAYITIMTKKEKV